MGTDEATGVGVDRTEELFQAACIPAEDGSTWAVAVDREELALLPEYSASLPTLTAGDGVKRWKTWIGDKWYLGRYVGTPDGIGIVYTLPKPTRILEIDVPFTLGMIDAWMKVLGQPMTEAVVRQLARGVQRVRANVVALGQGQAALKQNVDETRELLERVLDDGELSEQLLAEHGLIAEMWQRRRARDLVRDTAEQPSTGDETALREAIAHARDVARQSPGSKCGEEHEQLAGWLEELLRRRGRPLERTETRVSVDPVEVAEQRFEAFERELDARAAEMRKLGGG